MKKLKVKLHPSRNPQKKVSVFSFFLEQIQFLTECKRLGTADNYRHAAESLCAFTEGRDLWFTEIDTRLVDLYNDFLLRKGMARNSLSFHMRILRALYNKAVRRGYAKQTFPFREVYTGVDRTRKRAVGEQVISRLIQLPLEHRPALSFTRDLFLFSFYTRGMAFVDMVYLRKSDISGNVIRYVRHKTGQTLNIRVEPCIQAIIDRYSAPETSYVFPLLQNDDLPDDAFRRYKSGLRLYNKRLTQISRLLELEEGLSSYTSRHSWATMAHKHNIPVSVISAGMGHSSERTTQIYLASIEDRQVDKANQELLECLSRMKPIKA